MEFIQNDKVWIYDVEVYKFFFCSTFINKDTDEKRIFIIDDIQDDRLALISFLTGDDVSIIVGYNNSRYDDWILLGIKQGIDIYELSQFIITSKNHPIKYYKFEKIMPKLYWTTGIVSYDMVLDLTASSGMTSLKNIEGALGESIIESNIPFDLDRPLTQLEKDNQLLYNLQDVEVTKKIFQKFNKMDLHVNLIETFPNELKALDLNKTMAKKGAKVLRAKKIIPYNNFKYESPDVLSNMIKNKHLLNFYTTAIFSTENPPELKKIETLGGKDYIFGTGGLHMGYPFNYTGEIWNYDVASYYPSLMVIFNYISDASPDGKRILTELIAKRLKLKAKGDIGDTSLKLLINSVYGALLYKYSNMWDARRQVEICVTGQLLLFALCEQLEPYCTIIQANTDGVMLIPNDKEKIKSIVKKWEFDTKLVLELTIGKKIIQKDVNNYIYVNEDDKVKAKGSLIKYWNQQIHQPNFNLPISGVTNDYTIIHEALVRFFLYDTPIEDTIRNCDELIRFQRIYKQQGKYTKFFIGDQLLEGKVHRIFNVTDGGPVWKGYDDKKEKISNTSTNCITINNAILNRTTNGVKINYEFYIELAKEQRDMFLKK